MPQMAPALWVFIFITVIYVAIWMKSMLYFYKPCSASFKKSLTYNQLSMSWLW
uniref:ATP synthase F0 subunit 8 n=1 Tax=Linevichella vortex TaxID=686705 RepID=A0A1L5BWB1_9CRUS|nr:ATP synthase F0 subunit 8 [Linevichella vortex]